MLTVTALFWVRSALAAQQDRYQPYLVSRVDFVLPLPTFTPQPPGTGANAATELRLSESSPAPEEISALAVQAESPAIPPAEVNAAVETVESSAPAATEALQETVVDLTGEPSFTELEASGTPAPGETPTPNAADDALSSGEQMYPPPAEPEGPVVTEEPLETAPPAGPVIRLVISRLQVNRAVVPVELRRDAKGGLDWNTDPLFSTPNRPDLVGQLATSANPGEGGNIILVGHNYNNGWYNWEGVFVRLSSMQAGDEITLYTENGGEFRYIVTKVKKVPWQNRNLAELEKHRKYLWPTDHEQLTLVTCGGVNVWTWLARIYVVALPVTPAPLSP